MNNEITKEEIKSKLDVYQNMILTLSLLEQGISSLGIKTLTLTQNDKKYQELGLENIPKTIEFYDKEIQDLQNKIASSEKDIDNTSNLQKIKLYTEFKKLYEKDNAVMQNIILYMTLIIRTNEFTNTESFFSKKENIEKLQKQIKDIINNPKNKNEKLKEIFKKMEQDIKKKMENIEIQKKLLKDSISPEHTNGQQHGSMAPTSQV